MAKNQTRKLNMNERRQPPSDRRSGPFNRRRIDSYGSAFINRRRHPWLRRTYAILHAGLIDLDFKTLVKRITQLIVIAFVGVVAFSWINEIYDLPYLVYQAPPTPVNYFEAWMETGWAMFVMLLVLSSTQALLKQIRYMEGFLPVCSFCKKIRVEHDWVPIEHYLHEHSRVKMTHSLCPVCAKEHYGYVEGGAGEEVA
jgi:hypothetical protein